MNENEDENGLKQPRWWVKFEIEIWEKGILQKVSPSEERVYNAVRSQVRTKPIKETPPKQAELIGRGVMCAACSYEELVKLSSSSRSTVARALRRLVEIGWIQAIPGDATNSNIYLLGDESGRSFAYLDAIGELSSPQAKGTDSGRSRPRATRRIEPSAVSPWDYVQCQPGTAGSVSGGLQVVSAGDYPPVASPRNFAGKGSRSGSVFGPAPSDYSDRARDRTRESDGFGLQDPEPPEVDAVVARQQVAGPVAVFEYARLADSPTRCSSATAVEPPIEVAADESPKLLPVRRVKRPAPAVPEANRLAPQTRPILHRFANPYGPLEPIAATSGGASAVVTSPGDDIKNPKREVEPNERMHLHSARAKETRGDDRSSMEIIALYRSHYFLRFDFEDRTMDTKASWTKHAKTITRRLSDWKITRSRMVKYLTETLRWWAEMVEAGERFPSGAPSLAKLIDETPNKPNHFFDRWRTNGMDADRRRADREGARKRNRA